jgi:HEAT repeat protein
MTARGLLAGVIIAALTSVVVSGLENPPAGQSLRPARVDEIIEQLRSRNFSTAGNTRQQLIDEGSAALPSLAAIYRAAPDLRPDVMSVACQLGEPAAAFVESLDSDALDLLIEAATRLSEPSTCAPVMAKIGTPAIAKLLALIGKEPPAEHEVQAIRILASIGDARAVPALIHTLANSSSFNSRQAAASALGQLRASEAVEALERALHDESRWVRMDAALALGRIDSERAREAVIGYLRDGGQDRSMRASVARELQKSSDPLLAAAARTNEPRFVPERWLPGQWLLFYLAIAAGATLVWGVLAYVVQLSSTRFPALFPVQFGIQAISALIPAWYGFMAATVGSLLVSAFVLALGLILLGVAVIASLSGGKRTSFRTTLLIAAAALYGGYVLGILFSLGSPHHVSS